MEFKLINTYGCGYLDGKYIEKIEKAGYYKLKYKKVASEYYDDSYDCTIFVEDTFELTELYKLVGEELIIYHDDNKGMIIEIYDYWRE